MAFLFKSRRHHHNSAIPTKNSNNAINANSLNNNNNSNISQSSDSSYNTPLQQPSVNGIKDRDGHQTPPNAGFSSIPSSASSSAGSNQESLRMRRAGNDLDTQVRYYSLLFFFFFLVCNLITNSIIGSTAIYVEW